MPAVQLFMLRREIHGIEGPRLLRHSRGSIAASAVMGARHVAARTRCCSTLLPGGSLAAQWFDSW